MFGDIVHMFCEIWFYAVCLCALVSSSVSLHPGLQGRTSCSSSTQDNIVAAIVQRAAAEAAAQSSRQSLVDADHQPPQLSVSSTGQVRNGFC